MPKLTDLTIKNAKEGIMWDDTVRGLGIRKGKNRTTFIVLVGSGRRHRIGHYPEMTLADARRTAKEMLAEKTLGLIKPKQHAFNDAKKDFLASKASQERTVKEYTRILDNHFLFGRKNLVDIQPRTIVQILNKIEKTSERHHSYVAAKVFFNWCVKQHILEHSPMDHINPPQKGRPRDRLLNKRELQVLCQHTREPNTTFLAIVRLLILTGARCNEIAHLEWSWIKDGTITIPNTKNQQPHTFPYGPGVQKVLNTLPHYKDCPYLFPAARTVSEKTTVFNGWSKSKRSLTVILESPDTVFMTLEKVSAREWLRSG
ncbi:MAG: tyrosine-type recombinase/integrase [Halobacteriota archaeon]